MMMMIGFQTSQNIKPVWIQVKQIFDDDDNDDDAVGDDDDNDDDVVDDDDDDDDSISGLSAIEMEPEFKLLLPLAAAI